MKIVTCTAIWMLPFVLDVLNESNGLAYLLPNLLPDLCEVKVCGTFLSKNVLGKGAGRGEYARFREKSESDSRRRNG